jgi:hypothetical protein
MANYTIAQTAAGRWQVQVIEAGKPSRQSPDFDSQADAELWALRDARDQQALDQLPPERRD